MTPEKSLEALGRAAFEAGRDPRVDAMLERLEGEDALGQLLERRGTMAALGTEAGDVKLSWVDQLAWLREHPDAVVRIEEAAADLVVGDVRHVIWAGMGGSVACVRSLRAMGFLNDMVRIHPLESTDPTALNQVLAAISEGKGSLAAALASTAMVAVAMGMTSEEPISHLRWFAALLEEHEVANRSEHMLVMTIQDSFLDRFAVEHGIARLPIQPDGECHTAGRMSAPSTHVFLIPATLALGRHGLLSQAVDLCQASYRLRRGLGPAERDEILATDPFIRLAAWLAGHMIEGQDKVLLRLSPELEPLGPWVEQVIEESLGKGSEGLLIFLADDQADPETWDQPHLILTMGDESREAESTTSNPSAHMRFELSADRVERIAEIARFFAGWNLVVALVGYLGGITFAGQPAVEGYKRYAREIRDEPGPLPYPEGSAAAEPMGRLLLHYADIERSLGPTAFRDCAAALGVDLRSDPGGVLATTCRLLGQRDQLGYLDLTLNANPEGPLWDTMRRSGMRLAQGLGLPVKIRSGPRDYHSTEQSETDGPPGVLSLRILVRDVEPIAAGVYTSRFLHAQALGTMLAMRDAGRPILLAVLDRPTDIQPLERLFARAQTLLTEIKD